MMSRPMTDEDRGKLLAAPGQEITVDACWELMAARSFPALHTEVGTIVVAEGRVWRVCVALPGTALYLMTDLAHPADPKCTAIYRLPTTRLCCDLAERLRGDDGPPQQS